MNNLNKNWFSKILVVAVLAICLHGIGEDNTLPTKATADDNGSVGKEDIYLHALAAEDNLAAEKGPELSLGLLFKLPKQKNDAPSNIEDVYGMLGYVYIYDVKQKTIYSYIVKFNQPKVIKVQSPGEYRLIVTSSIAQDEDLRDNSGHKHHKALFGKQNITVTKDKGIVHVPLSEREIIRTRIKVVDV